MDAKRIVEHTTQLTVLLVMWLDVCVDAFILGLLAASLSVHELV